MKQSRRRRTPPQADDRVHLPTRVARMLLANGIASPEGVQFLEGERTRKLTEDHLRSFANVFTGYELELLLAVFWARDDKSGTAHFNSELDWIRVASGRLPADRKHYYSAIRSLAQPHSMLADKVLANTPPVTVLRSGREISVRIAPFLSQQLESFYRLPIGLSQYLRCIGFLRVQHWHMFGILYLFVRFANRGSFERQTLDLVPFWQAVGIDLGKVTAQRNTALLRKQTELFFKTLTDPSGRKVLLSADAVGGSHYFCAGNPTFFRPGPRALATTIEGKTG